MKPTPQRLSQLLAWSLYDLAASSFHTLILTFVFAAYFTSQIAADKTTGTAAWGNTLGIAGLITALLAPILGAMADQYGKRKPWIALFTLICVVSSALLWFARPQPAYFSFSLWLVAIGSIAAELAIVFYNAMLPALAPPAQIGRWSGLGWGAGYLGGIICLSLALFVFVQPQPPLLGLDAASAEPVRATFVLVSAWYLLFALPLLALVPEPDPTTSMRTALSAGLVQLRQTWGHLREYRLILRFMIARMLFIDGLATLFAFGGIYAAGTFGMSGRQILYFAITLNVTAGIGAFLFALIEDRIGSRTTILISLFCLMVVGIYVLCTQTVQGFWIGGAALGIFVGPAQAASRSYLARMAPEHLRNEMFGLLAFSGKATAFIGPLLVGWITQLTASQRWGMSTILVLFAAGFALMWPLPEARAGTIASS